MSRIMSSPVATVVQEPVAGPSSASVRAVSHSSTRNKTGKRKRGETREGEVPSAHVAASRPATSSEVTLSYDDVDVGNPFQFPHPQFIPRLEPGIHLEGPLLRNTTVRPIDFIELFITQEMVESNVSHTNAYAYIRIGSGSHKSYTQKEGSWNDTTSHKIYRLIGFLIYFGLSASYDGNVT